MTRRPPHIRLAREMGLLHITEQQQPNDSRLLLEDYAIARLPDGRPVVVCARDPNRSGTVSVELWAPRPEQVGPGPAVRLLRRTERGELWREWQTGELVRPTPTSALTVSMVDSGEPGCMWWELVP